MSRVELFEKIRKENREEGVGIRALAARHHVHRRTVREALASATPSARKVPERISPVLGPWQGTIRRWLTEDLDAPRKQRHTAHRVWERLTMECGAEVAEPTVRSFVARVRFELENHASLVMVPQTHRPGEECLCGFGGFSAWVAGALVGLWMFCMRLNHSGRGFHVAFAQSGPGGVLGGPRGGVRAFR